MYVIIYKEDIETMYYIILISTFPTIISKTIRIRAFSPLFIFNCVQDGPCFFAAVFFCRAIV